MDGSSLMSGQVASMNATQAAVVKAMNDARVAFLAKWAGRWEVSSWPTTVADEDPDEPYLHASSGAGLEGWPKGISHREWDAEVGLTLSEDSNVLVMDAHLYMWRPDSPATVLAILPERSVPHDEALAAAQDLVREITTLLDRLLYAHAEPLE